MGSVSTESGLKSEGGLILVKRVGPAEGWARATSLRLGLMPVPTDVREASLCPRRVGCPAATGTEEGAAGSVAASWLPALSFSTPETHAGTPMAGKEGSGCLTPWGWAGRAPGCPNPLVWPSELGFGGFRGQTPSIVLPTEPAAWNPATETRVRLSLAGLVLLILVGLSAEAWCSRKRSFKGGR